MKRFLAGLLLGSVAPASADYATTKCSVPVVDTYKCYVVEGQSLTVSPMKCRIA